MSDLRYFTFDLSEDTDGVGTVEAMASTREDEAQAVDEEVQRVLDWAWTRFPDSHGALDEGHDWDHDLQLSHEGPAGRRWRTVTLTLSGSPGFMAAFAAHFARALD